MSTLGIDTRIVKKTAIKTMRLFYMIYGTFPYVVD